MKNYFGDYLILGEIVIIGLAEAAHLAGVFFGLSFSFCTMLFWGSAAAAAVLGAGFLLVRKRFLGGKAGKTQKERMGARIEGILWILFGALLLTQLIFICMGDTVYRQGDMTVETVKSFLRSDGFYQVNPLTGMPYTDGMPSRLKILCLPTLYGCLCRLTGTDPGLLIWKIVPVIVLLSSYVSYGILGRCLFPDDRKKSCFFLIIAALLMWVGAYRYGMDGFDSLCCGWRGVVIRNGILLPWLFSLCLRRKWFCAVLCILAEACMVWTLYGCGVCLLAILGMAAAQAGWRIADGRKGAQDGRTP